MAEDVAECAARECESQTAKERPFCKEHWRMLTPTQKKAWEAGLIEDVLDWLQEKESLVHQAYRFELAPTPEQRRWLNLQCRQHRIVYNWAWGKWDAWWEESKGKPKGERPERPKNLYGAFNEELGYKLPWLKDCVANARNYALRDTQESFSNFLRRLGERKKGSSVDPGYPRRKKRHESNRFTIQPPTGTAGERWMTTHVRPTAIKLPKVGWVQTKEKTGKMRGRILRLSFEQRAGRWWIACMVEREPKEVFAAASPGGVIGLDLGVNAFLTLSRPYEGDDPFPYLSEDGQTIEPPRPLAVQLKRKRRLSRSLSRRASALYRRKLSELAEGPQSAESWRSRTRASTFQAVRRLALKLRHVEEHGDWFSLTDQGRAVVTARQPLVIDTPDGEIEKILPSRGWEKQKLAIGKLDFHIESIRRDFLNKLSTWLVRHYDVIVCEGFPIRELIEKKRRHVRRRKRRMEISDLGWGGLRLRLGYKAEWYGRRYIQLATDEPTDRTCHACGHVHEGLPPTNDFECENCGVVTSRQLNTALYCESFGREPDGTGGQPGTDAAGDHGLAGSQGPSGDGRRNTSRPSGAPGGDGHPESPFFREENRAAVALGGDR